MAQKIRTAGIEINDTDISLYVEGQGVIIREPARIASDINSAEPLYYGFEAVDLSKKMPGAYSITSPIFNGHITDPEGLEPVLADMFQTVGINKKTEILVAMPTGTSDNEKHALASVIFAAGAGFAGCIDTPSACVLGETHDPYGDLSCINVHCGMGSTDISLLKGCVTKFTKSIPYGVNKLNTAISTALQKKNAAKFDTHLICSIRENLANFLEDVPPIEVGAFDAVTNLPIKANVLREDVIGAIEPIVSYIAKYTKAVVDALSANIRAELAESCILLSGEGAFIPGFADIISAETGLICSVATEPVDCIIDGIGVVVENRSMLDPLVKNL